MNFLDLISTPLLSFLTLLDINELRKTSKEHRDLIHENRQIVLYNLKLGFYSRPVIALTKIIRTMTNGFDIDYSIGQEFVAYKILDSFMKDMLQMYKFELEDVWTPLNYYMDDFRITFSIRLKERIVAHGSENWEISPNAYLSIMGRFVIFNYRDTDLGLPVLAERALHAFIRALPLISR